MNFRLRDRPAGPQEIEIAALVGLADVLGEHRAVAARIFRRRRLPGGLAAGQFLVADVQMDAALVDVDLDLVAGLHEGERAADEAFRRDMQDAGAVAGAAHAAVGDADHVAHALPQQPLGDRQHAPFRHAGAALRAGVLQHQDMVGRDVEIVALDLAHHVVVVLEGDRLAAMLEEALVGGGRLDDAAVAARGCP